MYNNDILQKHKILNFIQQKYNIRLSYRNDNHIFITRFYTSCQGLNPKTKEQQQQTTPQQTTSIHKISKPILLQHRQKPKKWDDLVNNRRTQTSDAYPTGIMVFEQERIRLLNKYQKKLKIYRNNDVPDEQEGLSAIIKNVIDALSTFLTKERIRKTIRITSPITAIITNLAVLYNMDKRIVTTSLVILFLGVHMVALIEALLDTFNVYDIAYDFIAHHVNKAIEQYVMPVIMKPISWVRPNNSIVATIIGWIKPVLSVLLLTVGFFVPTLNLDEWCKTINTRMTTVDKVSNATTDLTNKVLEDVCGVDLYGSSLILTKRQEIAEEGIELLKIPTQTFIRNIKKRKELYEYTKKATEVLKEKLPQTGHDKLIKTLAPFNTIITNNIKLLAEIVKSIEECTNLPNRPPTVAVLLTGLPGVGKSRFSLYAMKQIAQRLSLDDIIYSVSRNEKYFDPYCGEHFGVHDEFLYIRSDDAIIPTLTKLLSGEYYNMEGAGVPAKRQACELKFVTFTTNIKDPSNKLLEKVNEYAVTAIWDRIVRVEIEDPLKTIRHDITGNLHRKPDYTHLTIKATISTDHNPSNKQYITMTPAEYIMYFAYRIATNITDYAKENDKIDLYPMERLEAYLSNNSDTFATITNKLLAAVKIIPANQFKRGNAKRNSGGRQFFVVRLEGKGGTGKTTTAFHMANRLKNIFSMPIIEVTDSFPHPLPKPCIYLVDDVLTAANCDQYLSWINLTNPRSIIIVVTNIKFPVRRTWMLEQYTDVTGFSESSGIVRRIGIQGKYRHYNDSGFVPSNNATQVKIEETMKVNGVTYDTGSLVNLVYDKYIAFVSQTRAITVVKDNHSIDVADIHIKARNFETFNDAMSSKSKLIAGLLKPSEDFTVTLSSISILDDFKNLKSPDTFVIGNITNANEFEANVTTLIEKLCVYKPEAKVIIEIKEESISAGYTNRCLYINKDVFDVSNIIKHHESDIYIPRNGILTTIDLKDIAMLKATSAAQRSVVDLTASELDMICKYINNNEQLKHQLLFYITSYQLESDERKHLISFTIRFPTILKCIGFILSLCGIIYIGIKLYKYINAKDNRDDEYFPNTAPEEDSAITRKIQQRYYNEYSRGVDHSIIKQDIINDFGTDEWNKAEWVIRNTYRIHSNTAPEEESAITRKIQQRYYNEYSKGINHDIIKQDLINDFGTDEWLRAEWVIRNTASADELIQKCDWKGLQQHWIKYPTDIPQVTPNQVSQEMITFQSSNQIETLGNIVGVNLVILVNKKTQGKNFGIGIFGPYLISVAHAVEHDLEACFIINNGKQYNVTCTNIDRKRDLAVYKITNHEFSFRDIRHHFGTKDLFTKSREGYFLRPIQGDKLTAACSIYYSAKREHPLSDTKQFFHPDEGVYTARFATISRPNFIKTGDCGLPLVVREGGELKIVGIHNAVTNGSIAFFASVSREDFSIIQEVKRNSAMHHFHKPGTEFTTHEWYTKIIQDEKKTPRFDSYGLKVYGYHPEAHLPSFPKDSHRELLDKVTRNEIQERLPTKPSALSFKPLLMSGDKLVKDKRGVPHTLWTQSVKYAYRHEKYTKWNDSVYETTMRLTRERITRDYGKPRYMNLMNNINGDGTTNNKPWDMSTSAGPLVKKLYNINIKEPLFINTAKPDTRSFYIFAETEPAKHVRNMYEQYCAGIENGVPMSIWCKDNRKVELLPSEKVHEGKVRLFNEIDLSVNMTLKKYFGHMLTKILENHVSCPYKIGMDVYSEATIYHRNMDRIDGNLMSTDISGCDKTMPKEIILEFCKAFCQGYEEKVILALADSLTYTTHIMDGVIYLVDNGNESGSYVTTMLNCFAMEVITMYPVIEKLMVLGHNPTLQLVEDMMTAIYYGDDRSVKISKELKLNENDLIRCGSYFNFKVTPAKVQSQHISFCSREFIPDDDEVVFPRLKQTSVLSCLFWIKKRETKYIVANVKVALFEASLHNKEFFSRIVNIVLAILNDFPEVTPYVKIYEYEVYRRVFKMFIYNEVRSPVLVETGETEEPKDINIVQNFEQLNINPNNYQTTQVIMDYVSHINHLNQKSSSESVYTYTSSGPKESPTWKCKLQHDGKEYSGEGKTKKAAQQQAAEKCVIPNNDTTSKQLIINMQVYDNWLNNVAYFAPYSKVGLATINDDLLSVNLDPHICLDELIVDLHSQCLDIIKSDMIKIFINGKLEEKRQILIARLIITPNNDQPIEPAVINQAAMGQQRATLPSQTNPQPTAINPAMTHDGDDIMGAVSTALPETLNPIGAPDMLAVGAITFDIKDLIYQQFLDCDTQLIVSDDAVEGSIIAQIPYGLHSDYINSYIKYYAQAHERFNGSLQFRFTVIGNPLFSGAIGIAWYPRKITSKTLPISELMKYSYQAEGVTTPWNKIHILHDARREHFYRLVEDEEGDYDARPHLVIFLMMSLQNPLKEGVQTRIRIASKLANSSEPNPFTFSNPDILTKTPSLASFIPGIGTQQGMNVANTFPHVLNIDDNVFTDGIIASPQVFDFGVGHTDLKLSGPARGGYIEIKDGKKIGDALQFRSGQNFRQTLDESVPEKFCKPTLIYWTNVPDTQFSLFTNALINVTGGTSSQSGLNISEDFTTSIPDLLYNKLAATARGLRPGYSITGFMVSGMLIYRPDTQGPNRFGSIKMITTHGVIVIDVRLQDVLEKIVSVTTQEFDAKKMISSSGYVPIDTPRSVYHPFSNLPTGYQILRISNQTVSAILESSVTTATATDDASVSMYYKRLAEGLSITECIQFELQDSISYKSICTVRYLQEFGIFVINTTNTNAYALFGQKFSELYITTPTVISRSNTFPLTDTSTWINRSSKIYLQNLELELISKGLLKIEATPNSAMLAGGMLSGLGSAMGQKSKNKHELTLQANQQQHEKDLQSSDQTYGYNYQKRNFAGNAILSAQNYRQTSKLGAQYAKQSSDLSKQQHAQTLQQQEKQLNQQVLLSGARADVSGATTASSTA